MVASSPDPPNGSAHIVVLDRDLVDAWFGPVVSVYADAFTPPPYHRSRAQVSGFAATVSRHAHRPGWYGFAALDSGDDMVGFTYGYTTKPGQWWHDQVRRALGPSADRWLDDSFEYVELAVRPQWQGRGLGRLLHDRLMAAHAHPRSVLTTLDAPTAGLGLYRSSGWQVIAEGFRFERTTIDYLIMGRENPAQAAPGTPLG